MIITRLPSLSICDSCKICFSNYCNFTGRGRRSEYWWFFFVCGLINGFFEAFILYFFVKYDCPNNHYSNECKVEIEFSNAFYICLCSYLVVAIITSIPLLAASVRRLHDVGYSGLTIILGIFPIVNLFVLYLLVSDSDMEPNIYGEPPKYNYRQNSSFRNSSVNQGAQRTNPPLLYENPQVPNYSQTKQPLINQELIHVNEMNTQNEENQPEDQLKGKPNTDDQEQTMTTTEEPPKEININEEENKEGGEQKEDLINKEEE